MIIGIDFDGTIVDHQYPRIGDPVPGAIEWMKTFQSVGADLILWTMRSGDTLQEAVDYCRENGIEFFGVNENPTQKSWTTSPKAYCHQFIDDANACTPLIQGKDRAMVDWSIVGPVVMKKIMRNQSP